MAIRGPLGGGWSDDNSVHLWVELTVGGGPTSRHDLNYVAIHHLRHSAAYRPGRDIAPPVGVLRLDLRLARSISSLID
jgi:hypothetical protein